MTPPLLLLLAILASYRLAHMVAEEDGPFDVFAQLRDWVGQANWIGRGFHCGLCLSFWLALGMVCLLPPLEWPVFLLAWLGVAGGAVVLLKLLP